MTVPSLVGGKIGQVKIFVDTTLQSCIVESHQLRFNKNVAQQLYAICVYGTILEIARDALELIMNHSRISPAILLRSLLEAYADLVNIIKDENYLNHMYASTIDQKIKMLESALKSETPFLKPLSEDPELCKKRIKELKESKPRGYEPFRINKKFELAGLEDIYVIYRLLCTETHHDMQAIEERHLQIEDNNELSSISFFKEINSETAERYIFLLGDITINSSLRISEFLKSPRLEALKEVYNKYQEFQKGDC